MKSNIIIIPIYKSIPDWIEIISFNQCLNVLFKHPICIFSYKGLDISYYINLLEKFELAYRIEYFDKKYFDNLAGYNKLMLSIEFYKRFKDFDYILLYQLDAYIFRDELDYWCQKGYDYIGAPWFENYSSSGTEFQEFAGNGGFSLRKVESIIKLLNSFKLDKSPKELLLYDYKKYTFLMFLFRLPKNFIKSFGYRNTFKFYTSIYKSNEDALFVNIVPKYFPNFKVPSYYEAIPFSFECQPKKLYAMNNQTLPFGCHGWYKYDFDFWRQFIGKNDCALITNK